MAWINEFLGKVGLSEIATLYENNKEKAPDEFDIDKAANDYLETRKEIFKSSDDFKKAINENAIVAVKQLRKQINDELGVGLSGEEAAKIELSEFTKKIKTKYSEEIEAAKNGRTSEWQTKHETLKTEFDNFKKLHETELANWDAKYKELETKTAREEARLKREKVFDDVFSKLDFGKDQAHIENAKIIVKSRLNELGWKYTDDGSKLFKGENDVITTADGHTIIKDLESGIKTIATERKLFPQANTGNQQPGNFTPQKTGNEQVDNLISAQMSELERIKNIGKK